MSGDGRGSRLDDESRRSRARKHYGGLESEVARPRSVFCIFFLFFSFFLRVETEKLSFFLFVLLMKDEKGGVDWAIFFCWHWVSEHRSSGTSRATSFGLRLASESSVLRSVFVGHWFQCFLSESVRPIASSSLELCEK